MKLLMKLMPIAVMAFVGINGYQKLADTGKTAVNFAKINATQGEIAGFISMIAVEHQIGNGFPYDFKQFVIEHFQKPDGSEKEIWQDAWFNDYVYQRKNEGCRVSSMGPDEKRDTKDDIAKRYGRY